MANDVSPQWVRETLCEDLADIDRASGRLPDTRAIERVVEADITRAQASWREAKPKLEPRKAEDNTHDAAKRAAASHGHEFAAKKAPDEPIRQHACKCGGGRCRHCKMFIRVAALLEQVPRAEQVAKAEPWKNARHPAFARELIHLFMLPKMSRRAIDIKARDPKQWDRIVRRKIEDICDRSNAIVGLGPWYTK